MMASTNEELVPPPKPRPSPFDYRNTDLVSRLLAATPPYLYNMPLVPHSFFFSEMLRSLVQAKAENAARSAPGVQYRRSRKRSWTQAHSDYYKEHPKVEKPEMPPPTGWGKEKPTYINKPMDNPLELTMEKVNKAAEEPKMESPSSSTCGVEKSEVKFPLPPLPTNSSSTDMILPPPPPVWYPPMYPTPYGIDPLHFFIDLRVSGHIYDRKNQKDSASSPHTTSSATSPNPDAEEPPETSEMPSNIFKQSNRHNSAFSVPSSRLARNIPINLSNYHRENTDIKDSSGHTRFDVKSLGFERKCNETGTNYVMKNLYRIYRNLHVSYKTEPEEIKIEEARESSDTTTDTEGNDKETEEEKEKKVRDLRALIGLELVVDYMNHSKPGQRTVEDSSTDVDSSDSTAVDVVAIPEEAEDCSL